jgi:hypothetical protein
MAPICDRCGLEPTQCRCDNNPRVLNRNLSGVPPVAVSRGWGDMSWLNGPWLRGCG